MLKGTFIIGLIAFLILSFPMLTHAAQYYDQYPGNGFLAADESSSYYRDWAQCFIYHDDTDDTYYYCPVTFNVPDGSTYFVKSIGIRFKDDLPDGQMIVELRRKNLYTGNVHIMASWTSGVLNSSSSDQTASKGTASGFKLVDTKKFVYWLNVHFWRDGVLNPTTSLILYQVRVHYGT